MPPRWGYVDVAPIGYTDGAPMGLVGRLADAVLDEPASIRIHQGESRIQMRRNGRLHPSRHLFAIQTLAGNGLEHGPA